MDGRIPASATSHEDRQVGRPSKNYISLQALINGIMEVIDLRCHAREIRASFGVKRMGIFGSFARGEEKETSDIDILVEFEKTHFHRLYESFLLTGRFVPAKCGSCNRQGTASPGKALC
jgi:hypothetical protein